MTKLKPCPFCGNEDIKFWCEFPNGAKTFSVICEKCGGEIRRLVRRYRTEEECLEAIIKMCNTRNGGKEC